MDSWSSLMPVRAVARVAWGWVTLPYYVLRRRRAVFDWTNWVSRRAKRSGCQITLVADNAVLLDMHRADKGILTVSWVVCDRYGLTYTLASQTFETPAQAFDTYRKWAEFYLSDAMRAKWWALPKHIPEVPHV